MSDIVTADFPLVREDPFAPPAAYAIRRELGPVTRVRLFDGSETWLVTRLKEGVEALSNPAMLNDKADDRYPHTRPNLHINHPSEKALQSLDGEPHVRYRRMVGPEFTVKRVEALRPRIATIASEAVDRMVAKGQPGDLVKDYGMVVASAVICEILGVPYEDHAYFQDCTERLTDRNQTREGFLSALAELHDYMKRLVESARDLPPEGNGMLSRLQGKVREGGLRESQLVNFAFVLLLAGHETSANMISLGALTFIRRPDLLRRVQDEPSLWPAAVNELLRYHSILDDVTNRFADSDTEIGGVVIGAGEGVAISQLSANFDPAAFHEPERLDFDRPPVESLAFGAGAHKCLGQNLARVELEVAYQTLFERLPDLRLDVPLEQLRFKNQSVSFGLHSLPVKW